MENRDSNRAMAYRCEAYACAEPTGDPARVRFAEVSHGAVRVAILHQWKIVRSTAGHENPMRKELLPDDASQRAARCIGRCAGDRDFLRLRRSPLRHAEEEAEADSVALDVRR